jgi:hypothetical protein
VLEAWTVTVQFTNAPSTRIASGTYFLTSVPDGTAFLSAKTNWTLRRRLPAAFVDAAATVDFTGDSDLLGGDLDRNNLTNFVDYLVLRNNWFTHENIADINGDGNVNLPDFLLLRANWYQTGSAE